MRKRRLALLGFVTGLVLLALLLLPAFCQRLQAARLQRIRQDRLQSAGGQGQTAANRQPLLIVPKPGGSLPTGTTVSLNGHRWYPLGESGVVSQEDAAIWQTVYVALGNRRAALPISDAARQSQVMEADLSPAPQVAELAFFENLKPGQQAELPVKNAKDALLMPALAGMELHLQGDKIFLSLPPDMMQRRFFCTRVLVQNELGQALCELAVLPQLTEDYIPIRTAAQLQAIKNNPGGCYRLMNDIDLLGQPWQPVGSEAHPFCGLLDGGGHAISGLCWPPQGQNPPPEDCPDSFSLVGYARHAIIRNLRIKEPQIDASACTGTPFAAAALLQSAVQTLVENCQVQGGQISNRANSAAGFAITAYDSVFLHLFNSCRITARLPANLMCDSGGIAGIMGGYMAFCANEGEVYASHLTGGLLGLGSQLGLSHCINSGEVVGFPFIGKYPPGALFQTMDGNYATSCLMLQGNAACAGNAYQQSNISRIQLILQSDLQNKAALSLLGSFEGENAQWLLDERIAQGPIPRGIVSLKVYRPGGALDE